MNKPRMNSLTRMLLMCGAIVLNASHDAWGQVCQEWQQATVSGRSGSRLAFDSKRGVTIMFGGSGGGTPTKYFNDTAEWDGTRWAIRHPSNSPSPRSMHAMTYDAARQRIVVFGGMTGQGEGYDDETWEWDGNDWRLRATHGPVGRSHAGFTYDSHRGVCVLYGGYDGVSYRQDTWEWNGSTWHQRHEHGPDCNSAYAFVYDKSRAKSVLVTSKDGVGKTWEWNGTNWQQRLVANSPTFNSQGACFNTNINRVMVHGGFTGATNTWVLEDEGWVHVSDNGPLFAGGGITFDSKRDRVVIYGAAFFGNGVSSTWEYDQASWTKVQESPYNVAASPHFRLGVNDGTSIFVGTNATACLLWSWNGVRWGWSGVPFSKPIVAAFDSNRKILVSYGHRVPGSLDPRGTCEYDGTTWTMKNIAGPILTPHQMVFDSYRGTMLLISGYPPETREWNGSDWIDVQSENHPDFVGPSAFDEIRNVVVMTSNGKTWEWNGTNWLYQGFTPDTESIRYLYFDAATGRIRGCSAISNAGEVLSYEWSGRHWRLLPHVLNNQIPWDFAVAYDPARLRLVFFNFRYGETYEIGSNQSPPGDITCDGVVNVSDLLAVITAWGPCPAPPSACVADVAPEHAPDGIVNVQDLLRVIQHWGRP